MADNGMSRTELQDAARTGQLTPEQEADLRYNMTPAEQRQLFGQKTWLEVGPRRWTGENYVQQVRNRDTGETDWNVDNQSDATMFGGSDAATRSTAESLARSGQNTLDVYTGLAARQQAQQQGYADALGANGTAAFGAGMQELKNARSLTALAQAQANSAPSTFGNQATNAAWSNAIRSAQNFAPSRDSLVATETVAGYPQGSVDSRLGDSYSRLVSYADRGPGPSAAEAQLRSATAQNVASQFALASSGRNAGQNAMAMRQAGFQAADLGQRSANDLATLRANEEAAWRGQQLQALNASGGVASNLESAAFGRQSLGLNAATTAAQLYAGQDALRAQNQQFAAQQYGAQYGSEAAAQQAAFGARQGAIANAGALQNQQYLQLMGNYGQIGDATKSAAGISSASNAATLAATQAGTGAQMGYNQSALDLYTGNTNRAAARESNELQARTQYALQDASLDFQASQASAARDERNLDRAIGAAGSGAQVLGTIYGGG